MQKWDKEKLIKCKQSHSKSQGVGTREDDCQNG